LNFVCNDIENIYESFCLNILSKLLFDEPNGILYKNLISTNLIGGFSPGSGFEVFCK
jgi:hypothetical protein